MSLARCPRVLLGTTFRPTSRSAFLALPQRPGMRGAHSAPAKSAQGGDGASCLEAGERRQAAAAAAPAAAQQADGTHFKVLREEQVHRRYLSLYNRTVQFPTSSGQAEVRCGRLLAAHTIGAGLGLHQKPSCMLLSCSRARCRQDVPEH